MQDLSIIIDELREEMIQTLKEWIRVPSVKALLNPALPLAARCGGALDLVLSDAAAMGFETRNFDGYAGDVRMGRWAWTRWPSGASGRGARRRRLDGAPLCRGN